MNTCADFCTAAKCDELEARIASLEQALALLEAAFEAHTNQDVYEGHNFSPTITINHEFHDFVLLTNLTFDSTNVDAYVDLNELLISSFDIGIYELGDNFFDLGMSINGIVRTTQFQVETDEHIVSNLAIDGSFEGDYLNLTVADGESEATAQIYFDALTDGEHVVSNLAIDGIHSGNYLYLTVADGESVGTATIYLDSTTIINNGGGDTVGCEQTEQKIEDCCGELAALINSVSAQLTNTESILSQENQEISDLLTIDIEGETISEFNCGDGDDEEPSNVALTYAGKGFQGIHNLLKTINPNLYSVFKAACTKEIEIAAPSWWQVRLGGDVPQICCTFRRVGTRNYHSLTIPHPLSTDKPSSELLPTYTKGNVQGMIVCRDNSKFIVNANTVAEAERVANIARTLIDPNYLPDPFKVWIGERKGEAVNVDVMKPTSIFYYSTGQKNTKPDWRVGLSIGASS